MIIHHHPNFWSSASIIHSMRQEHRSALFMFNFDPLDRLADARLDIVMAAAYASPQHAVAIETEDPIKLRCYCESVRARLEATTSAISYVELDPTFERRLALEKGLKSWPPANVLIGSSPRTAGDLVRIGAAGRFISIDARSAGGYTYEWTAHVFGEEFTAGEQRGDVIEMREGLVRKIHWVFIRGKNRERIERELARAMKDATPVYARDVGITFPPLMSHPAFASGEPYSIHQVPAEIPATGEPIAIDGGYLAPMDGQELDEIVPPAEEATDAPAEPVGHLRSLARNAAERFRKAYCDAPVKDLKDGKS